MPLVCCSKFANLGSAWRAARRSEAAFCWAAFCWSFFSAAALILQGAGTRYSSKIGNVVHLNDSVMIFMQSSNTINNYLDAIKDTCWQRSAGASAADYTK